MAVYGLKVNMSIAIIAMVNHTAIAMETPFHDDHGSNITDECVEESSQLEEEKAKTLEVMNRITPDWAIRCIIH